MIFKSFIPSITLDNVSDYLDDIIDYHYQFKVFATPFEDLYPNPPCLQTVDRIYNATIEDEDITGDTLYNVSFRFIGNDGVLYYAYAHMRINYGYDIENEFIRGTMFVTKKVRIFFMTTVSSIEQTDDLHNFLIQDGLNLCFDENNLPLEAHVALANYTLQINLL
jgi:hypothetical protein